MPKNAPAATLGDRRLDLGQPAEPRSWTGHRARTSRRAVRQVSRLGNPLVNEVITPMAQKDFWNSRPPSTDYRFAQFVDAGAGRAAADALPGRVPEAGRYDKPRADLAAILLTGIPTGVIPGFQNFTGDTKADLLRLNMAVPPSRTRTRSA